MYILPEKSLSSFSSTLSSRQKHQVSHEKSDKCFFHVVYQFFVGWKLVQFLWSLSHRPSLAEMWAAIPGTVNLFLSFVFNKLTLENILSHATLETGNGKSLNARVEINENSSILPTLTQNSVVENISPLLTVTISTVSLVSSNCLYWASKSWRVFVGIMFGNFVRMLVCLQKLLLLDSTFSNLSSIDWWAIASRALLLM